MSQELIDCYNTTLDRVRSELKYLYTKFGDYIYDTSDLTVGDYYTSLEKILNTISSKQTNKGRAQINDVDMLKQFFCTNYEVTDTPRDKVLYDDFLAKYTEYISNSEQNHVVICQTTILRILPSIDKRLKWYSLKRCFTHLRPKNKA